MRSLMHTQMFFVPGLVLLMVFGLHYHDAQLPELERIHNTLTDFYLRKQLFIETLPPLSFPFSAYTRDHAPRYSTLATSGTFGDLILSLVALIAPSLIDQKHGYKVVAILQSSLLLPSLLTMQYVDSILVHVMCLSAAVMVFSKRAADPSRSLMRETLKLVCSIVGMLSLHLIILCTIISVIMPSSELSYGGNYNLRFLSPNFRRQLRNSPQAPTWGPPSQLKTMVPYSLYVHHVGFLWTDEQVWDDGSGVFVPEQDFGPLQENDTASFHVPGHRLIFRDRINIASPWLFQRSADTSLNDGLESRHLETGGPIVIRNVETKEFIQVEPDRMSVLDMEAGAQNTTEPFVRLGVSVSDKYSEEAVWQPFPEAGGVRFFSRAHRCFLSTSYRSFPDYDGLRVNDTMLHVLELDIESSCTRWGTKSASTFHVVDGYPSQRAVDDWDTLLESFLQTSKLLRVLVAHIGRGFGILLAMHDLYKFRSYYGDLQDTPPVLTHQRRLVSAEASTGFLMGRLIVLGFWTTLALQALLQQRCQRSWVFWSSPKRHKLILIILFLGLHSLSHLAPEDAVKHSCPTSEAVAAYGLFLLSP